MIATMGLIHGEDSNMDMSKHKRAHVWAYQHSIR